MKIKKITNYAIIIIFFVALISVGYYWWTCPPKVEVPQKPLPSIAEIHRKAMEAIDKGESYISPHDLTKIVEYNGNPVIVNELSMMLKDGEGKETAEEIADKVKGVIVGFLVSFNEYYIELPISTLDELKTALSIVNADSRVEAAVTSGFLKADWDNISDNEYYSYENDEEVWAYTKIKIAEAWQAIKDSGIKLHPVKVAVIDTGLDRFHREFKDIDVKGRNEIPKQPLTYFDDNGHGTSVAGVIAAANNNGGMNGVLTGLSNDGFELQIYKTGMVEYINSEGEKDKCHSEKAIKLALDYITTIKENLLSHLNPN